MFEIIIRETRTVTQQVGREWKVVGQVDKHPEEGPYSASKPPFFTDEYGYTPLIEKTVEETIERYRQCKEEIDLDAIIKAVNHTKWERKRRSVRGSILEAK